MILAADLNRYLHGQVSSWLVLLYCNHHQLYIASVPGQRHPVYLNANRMRTANGHRHAVGCTPWRHVYRYLDSNDRIDMSNQRLWVQDHHRHRDRPIGGTHRERGGSYRQVMQPVSWSTLATTV